MPSPSLLMPDANWLEYICEPKRLILAWQAPDQFGVRFRWAVGEISQESAGFEFRYIEGSEFETLNQGKNAAELQRLGYRGYPAFDTRQTRHAQSVLAAF